MGDDEAARALYAASSSAGGAADVYLADQDYYDDFAKGMIPDPTCLSDFESTYGSIDVDDHTTFPTWPEFTPSDGDRAHVEVDLIRWAMGRFM